MPLLRRRRVLTFGGLASAGIAVVLSHCASPTVTVANRGPAARLSITPEGQALVGVTSVTFSANATDPDGDSLSYAWTFGDGAGATSASASHVYVTEGAFEVLLKVTDGRAETMARGSVTVSTLSDDWSWDAVPDNALELLQNAASITGLYGGYWPVLGAATDPRRARFQIRNRPGRIQICPGQGGGPDALSSFDLTADASLQRLVGVVTNTSCSGSQTTRPATLVRR